MPSYTNAQLQDLWIQAGGNPSLAPTMAAIALAESSGNPASNNYHDSNGQGGTQTSWGLWQISNGTHSMPVPNINNPLVNAQQAVKKLHDQGLGAWGTYTSGAYLQYLTGAQSSQPISKMGARSSGQPGGSSSSSSASSSSSSHNPFAIHTWFGTIDLTNFVFLTIGLVILLVGGFILVAGSINIPVLKGGSS